MAPLPISPMRAIASNVFDCDALSTSRLASCPCCAIEDMRRRYPRGAVSETINRPGAASGGSAASSVSTARRRSSGPPAPARPTATPAMNVVTGAAGRATRCAASREKSRRVATVSRSPVQPGVASSAAACSAHRYRFCSMIGIVRASVTLPVMGDPTEAR